MTKKLLAVVTLMLAGFTMAGLVQAQAEEKAATLKIEKPWTRVTPPGAKVAAGFVTITNTGSEADRLVGATASLSKHVEVHEMSMKDGVMRMQEVADGIEIAPGATVVLQPGGYHMMFMELSASPKVGEPVKGTLKFAKAGELPVVFAVAPLGAKSIDGGGKMTDSQKKDEMDHGSHHMKH